MKCDSYERQWMETDYSKFLEILDGKEENHVKSF